MKRFFCVVRILKEEEKKNYVTLKVSCLSIFLIQTQTFIVVNFFKLQHTSEKTEEEDENIY